jgi:hypothetical protein
MMLAYYLLKCMLSLSFQETPDSVRDSLKNKEKSKSMEIYLSLYEYYTLNKQPFHCQGVHV